VTSTQYNNDRERPYIIVPPGTHLLELLRYNPRRTVAAIDWRANGALQRAGVDELVKKVYSIGPESPWPLLSIAKNRKYYSKLSGILDGCLHEYPDARFIITANYTPFNRFIIDHVGPRRVELWEDGLNHYIKLESLLTRYKCKEIVKMFAGMYSRGLFDTNYQGQKIKVCDRFNAKNLSYPTAQLAAGRVYYIGQPLIEDSLISESDYKVKLARFFSSGFTAEKVVYLPHPREQKRAWLSQIFQVECPGCSAEQYLIEQGASGVYSAFSTVNVNIQTDKNCFLANELGLQAIAKRLAQFNFPVELI